MVDQDWARMALLLLTYDASAGLVLYQWCADLVISVDASSCILLVPSKVQKLLTERSEALASLDGIERARV